MVTETFTNFYGIINKEASRGQAIVNSEKPKSSLASILFGTSVELDHLFGSKWLLTELN